MLSTAKRLLDNTPSFIAMQNLIESLILCTHVGGDKNFGVGPWYGGATDTIETRSWPTCVKYIKFCVSRSNWASVQSRKMFGMDLQTGEHNSYTLIRILSTNTEPNIIYCNFKKLLTQFHQIWHTALATNV